MAEGNLDGAVGAALGVEVVGRSPVTGGDVAQSFRLRLADDRTVFAKTHRSAPPGFFTTEAAGLRWLGSTGAVDVPRVLAVSDGTTEDDSAGGGEPNFLVLEWIDPGRPAHSTEVELGRALAAVHRWPGWADLCGSGPAFGRPDRRTTGSRGLPNEPCASWAEFYATQRLLPLARIARDSAALPESAVVGLEDVAGRLEDLGGPPEPPSLVHGDLWSGNRLVGADGRSWLIDPAAHGGHREFDLAMMRLFGGFDADCFVAYQEVAPLAQGWQDRVALHQLAPLVVHAIKFGGGYVSASVEAIEQYL